MELSINHFKLHETQNETKVTVSNKMLELLQRDGYAKNIQANTPYSSKIKLREWKTTIVLWEETTTLVYIEEKSELSEMLYSMNTQLNWLNSNKEIVLNKVCQDLLELKNSTWLDEQESPLSRELFIDNLSLDSIEFNENRDLIIGFTENNMFGGHIIQIGVKENLILETAEI